MITYKEYAPTQFDREGLGLESKQDWLVFIGQNRDSDALERSNYTCAVESLEAVDPENLDHKVHSFGHWACGWLEVVIVRPETAAHKVAEEIEACLASYPVLDDSHFSELEWSKHTNWIDQECARIARNSDKTLTNSYCPSGVAEYLEWYNEHERSPSDEKILEALQALEYVNQ